MPSSTLLQSQTDFFGSAIVWDYLAIVNALLVRILKTYPGCGMYGGYTCEWIYVHTHRHVNMCAYRVGVCNMFTCMWAPQWSCMWVFLYPHVYVFVHGHSCNSAGMVTQVDWNMLPEGIKAG